MVKKLSYAWIGLFVVGIAYFVFVFQFVEIENQHNWLPDIPMYPQRAKDRDMNNASKAMYKAQEARLEREQAERKAAEAQK